MTSLRRLAPLSLALSMLLVAGTASASAPAAKREGVMKSLGKTAVVMWKTGRADFKARREAAGPGLIKRSLTKAGEKLSAMRLAVKEFNAGVKTELKSSWAGMKADGRAARQEVVDAARATGAKWRAVKNGARAGVAAFKASRAERKAQRAALKTANKEIEAFMSTQPLDVRAAFAQAKSEAKVGKIAASRAVYATATAATVVGGLATNMPEMAALGGAAGGTMIGLHNVAMKDARQDAYTKAVEYAVSKPGANVPSDKLEAWVKAGAIKDFLK